MGQNRNASQIFQKTKSRLLRLKAYQMVVSSDSAFSVSNLTLRPLSSASLFLSFRIVVLSNCVNKCSLESKSDRHVITRFPSTQKSSASRQIVKKTADLNLRSFSLLIMSTSSGADGLLRAWRHTDCVRTSFESLWNRVQAQNSTLCLQ